MQILVKMDICSVSIQLPLGYNTLTFVRYYRYLE